MMYIDFPVGEKTYKLRLTTRATVGLEKQIGVNPLLIFGANGDTIPTITVMVSVLHASLQALEHGISMMDAYDIFDNWLADGHTATEFIAVIMEIYKTSGLIQGEKSKNA